MGIFRSTAETSLGLVAIVMMVAARFAIGFITPFALLTIGRLIYCSCSNAEFSIVWSIRGAVCLSALITLVTLANIFGSMTERAQGRFGKVLPGMALMFVGVFGLQIAWHGLKCLFTAEQFILLDKAWLGDALMAAICSIFACVYYLVKGLFSRA